MSSSARSCCDKARHTMVSGFHTIGEKFETFFNEKYVVGVLDKLHLKGTSLIRLEPNENTALKVVKVVGTILTLGLGPILFFGALTGLGFMIDLVENCCNRGSRPGKISDHEDHKTFSGEYITNVSPRTYQSEIPGGSGQTHPLQSKNLFYESDEDSDSKTNTSFDCPDCGVNLTGTTSRFEQNQTVSTFSSESGFVDFTEEKQSDRKLGKARPPVQRRTYTHTSSSSSSSQSPTVSAAPSKTTSSVHTSGSNSNSQSSTVSAAPSKRTSSAQVTSALPASAPYPSSSSQTSFTSKNSQPYFPAAASSSPAFDPTASSFITRLSLPFAIPGSSFLSSSSSSSSSSSDTSRPSLSRLDSVIPGSSFPSSSSSSSSSSSDTSRPSLSRLDSVTPGSSFPSSSSSSTFRPSLSRLDSVTPGSSSSSSSSRSTFVSSLFTDNYQQAPDSGSSFPSSSSSSSSSSSNTFRSSLPRLDIDPATAATIQFTETGPIQYPSTDDMLYDSHRLQTSFDISATVALSSSAFSSNAGVFGSGFDIKQSQQTSPTLFTIGSAPSSSSADITFPRATETTGLSSSASSSSSVAHVNPSDDIDLKVDEALDLAEQQLGGKLNQPSHSSSSMTDSLPDPLRAPSQTLSPEPSMAEGTTDLFRAPSFPVSSDASTRGGSADLPRSLSLAPSSNLSAFVTPNPFGILGLMGSSGRSLSPVLSPADPTPPSSTAASSTSSSAAIHTQSQQRPVTPPTPARREESSDSSNSGLVEDPNVEASSVFSRQTSSVALPQQGPGSPLNRQASRGSESSEQPGSKEPNPL